MSGIIKKKELKLEAEFKVMPETLTSPFTDLFPGYADKGLVKCHPGGTVMPSCYKEGAEKVYNYKARKDDTWIVTFPKCGARYIFLINCKLTN